MWSPNGERIAFVRRETYTSRLIVMRPNGTEKRVVARREEPYVLRTPDWAPRVQVR